MENPIARIAFVPLAAAMLLSAPMTAPAQQPDDGVSRNIQDYVQPGLKDLTLTFKTTRFNQEAGDEIGNNFGRKYNHPGHVSMYYKWPDMIRFDGTVLGFKGRNVTIGFNASMSVGWIHKSRDESQSLGEMNTLLDVGLLNDFYDSYTTARFQSIQLVGETRCAVFRVNYEARLHDASYRLLWIDPHTRTLCRREEYNPDGTLQAVYLYRDPVLSSGVWAPADFDVLDARGETAAHVLIQNVVANSHLSDSQFH